MSKMNRDQCEERIAELVEEIRKIHEQYNPDADYIGIGIFKNSYSFNNKHWEKDADYPIDYFKTSRRQ